MSLIFKQGYSDQTFHCQGIEEYNGEHSPHQWQEKKIEKIFEFPPKCLCKWRPSKSKSNSNKNTYDKTQHNKRFIFRTHVNLDERAYSNKKILL